MRPGYKTTEFWLSALATLLGLFVASGALGDDHYFMKVAGMALSALAALGYSAARAKVKSAESLAAAVVDPKESPPA